MEEAVLCNDSPAAPLDRPLTDARAGAGPGPAAELAANVRAASRFLKALSNHNRLLLLCLLSEREMTVTELEGALGLRQPAISQQLARLRAEGLVTGRRSGKSIHYSLSSEAARRVMELLYELFCEPASGERRAEEGNGEAAPVRAV